jgi:hypothetical protein
MSQFSQSHQQRRAPRANLRETIPVNIQLENGRQISAKLHQVSITGGLLELPTCLEERLWVKLTLPLGFNVVHFTAEMMFPMRGATGYTQPFRITRIETEDLHKLDTEITDLLKQNVAPATRGHGAGFRPPHFYLESF